MKFKTFDVGAIVSKKRNRKTSNGFNISSLGICRVVHSPKRSFYCKVEILSGFVTRSTYRNKSIKLTVGDRFDISKEAFEVIGHQEEKLLKKFF